MRSTTAFSGRWSTGCHEEELLEALIEAGQGSGLSTGAYIVGRSGVDSAYRTGRGSIIMRGVVDIEEDERGRTCLVVTELPYQVNPDTLTAKIAELADAGKVTGIADRDDSSSRTGQRLVVVSSATPSRGWCSRSCTNTQLQETFGGEHARPGRRVPRTLSLDAFVTHWIDHQIEVIQRRTTTGCVRPRNAPTSCADT